MSEIKFRPILESEIREVSILLNQLKQMDITSIDYKKAWSDFSSNSSSNSIVAIHKKKVVAYGSIVIENKIRGQVAGHIEDIVVDSVVRGKMLGVRLVKKLIEIGESKNCYRITLFCDKKLVSFYERSGFKVNNIMMKKFLMIN